MATQLDAVCLALVPLFQAAVPTVRVVDGPQANSEALDEWLFVGHDADDLSGGTEGAVATQEWMTSNVRREQGDVTSAVVVRSGSVDIPAVRARALSILADCETALRANRTLSGLVMQAELTEHRYFPVVTQSGCKARVVFTVTYVAQL